MMSYDTPEVQISVQVTKEGVHLRWMDYRSSIRWISRDQEIVAVADCQSGYVSLLATYINRGDSNVTLTFKAQELDSIVCNNV